MFVNRTVIFSFFDPEGIMDRETIYLLSELKRNANCIILVVNGVLKNTDSVQDIVDILLVRINLGMDAGAYKYALFHPQCRDIIRNSDELVLCNSTFYGPFCSMKDIFKQMEKSNADFWGLVRWQTRCEDCIQSYFLVYRKEILLDRRFYQYFDKYIDENTDSRGFVGASFERGLCYYLQEYGYRTGAFIETKIPDVYHYPYECLKNFRLPFMKKKCFQKELQICSFEEIMSSLAFIDRNTEYDCEMILESINRLYKWNVCHKDLADYDMIEQEIVEKVEFLSRQEILSFIDENSHVYIYGAGLWAEIIYYSFFLRNEKGKFIGFIVSDGQIKQEEFHGFPIFYYSEVPQKKEIGIIVAMGCKNMEQIKEHIKKENVIYMMSENKNPVRF